MRSAAFATILVMLAGCGTSTAGTELICTGFESISHAPMTDHEGELVKDYADDPGNQYDTNKTVEQIDAYNGKRDRVCDRR